MRSVPAKLYTKKYYLSSCRGFEEFLKGGISERLLYAFSLADLKKGAQVLDIGSGRGELLIKCAQAGAIAKGIDYSQAAVGIAKGNLSRVDKKVARRVSIKRMNAKKILYPAKFFDVVFMIDVVEHLYPKELRQVFLEVKRVLKPGGKVIIHTPNAWLIRLVNFLAKSFLKWEEHPGHVNEQSFFSLRRELRPFKGQQKLYFKSRKRCFSEMVQNVKNLPFWTIRLANFLDQLWENRVFSFFVYHQPLVFFLGTDLWAVIRVPGKERRSK